MKDNNLYGILDLIEEIDKVDKMIKIHQNTDSKIMLNQYSNQKLKLSGFLFKELLTNNDKQPEVMNIIKLFIEKFYNSELKNLDANRDDSFKQIEEVVSQNYN